MAACALAACGQTHAGSQPKDAWNEDNDPLLLSGDFVRGLGDLPLTGQAATVPWTDTYWPSYQGGIANRWRHPPADEFSYVPPSQQDLSTLSAAALADLSPAEKYDLYKGRYDFPTVRLERQRVHPGDETWEGICHGWAPAAINFDEPKPTLMTSDDGLQIPFGSSDIKALLSYYQGQLSNAPTRLLGTRCDIDLAKHPNAVRTHPECKGINAGAFHVALTNLVGLQHAAFVADVSHGNQIWNQPVYAFTSELVRTQPVSPGASPDAVSEAVIHTEMTYTDEVGPNWQALNGTPDFSKATAAYEYRLELDANGAIVGGAWQGSNLLDFVWTQGRPEFSGYFADVQQVYAQSQAGAPLAEPN